MALINIRHFHNLPLEEAKKRAENLLNELKNNVPGGSFTAKWNGNLLVIEGTSGLAKGVKAEVNVQSDCVVAGVDLPVLFRTFKDAVEGKLNAAIVSSFK